MTSFGAAASIIASAAFIASSEIWGRIMTRRAFNPFTCPNCKALYQVVKVEAGLETTDREITCQVCRDPLAGQEAKFVLKYFFLREGIRRKHGRAKAK